MSLSHRERVLRALSHQESDRVPFDFGSTVNSSIHVSAYQDLKAHFGVHAEDAGSAARLAKRLLTNRSRH
jgi:uroporphyrinogen decarboxylase